MDISFTCDKCGQSIVVDEAGAGISVDCPTCGKPVYVPSGAPLSTMSAPVRVEAKSAKALVATTSVSRVPNRPVTPAMEQKQAAIHPAIVASLACLLIGVAFGFVLLIVLHQSLMGVPIVLYMAAPFLGAAFWCATYGMCVGYVKHGLLLLAAMSLAIGIFYGAFLNSMPSSVRDMQRQIDQQFRQFMH